MKHSFRLIGTICLMCLCLSMKAGSGSNQGLQMADNIASKDKQPNIVLFFVDDLGWAHLGHRNDLFQTPYIDQLRQDGMEFQRAYIATPTCSPSRASLLTGKEPVRIHMVRHIPVNKKYGFDESGRTDQAFHIWPTDPVQMPSRNWLPLEEITYAERLREFGYYNIFIGKWHLGHEPYHPIHQGFDVQYGSSNGGHPKSYYPPFFHQEEVLSGVGEDYLTDVLTDQAVAMIETYDRPQPFMLSFWSYNVHSPFVGRRDWLKIYEEKGLEGKFAHYAAMVSAMDESVGRIRQACEQKGIADNTVFLFLSDQGGYFDNAPLSGGKRGGNTLGEGGARIPLIIHYPGLTEANSRCDVPVQSLDIFPTLMEIASGKSYQDSSIQGKSLLPLLSGGNIPERELFFFRSYEDQYTAIMSGEWKLIKYHSGKYELFRLSGDMGEQHNLINSEKQQAERLKRSLANWEKQAVPTAEDQQQH